MFSPIISIQENDMVSYTKAIIEAHVAANAIIIITIEN